MAAFGREIGADGVAVPQSSPPFAAVSTACHNVFGVIVQYSLSQEPT
jgi:hypothetical protein